MLFPMFNNPHTSCTIPLESNLPPKEANPGFRKTNSSVKRTFSLLPGSVITDLQADHRPLTRKYTDHISSSSQNYRITEYSGLEGTHKDH